MIDPHWELVDLDPVTWRHIGRFFDPGQYIRAAQPGEHGLFILHECGSVQRVVDSRTGVRRELLPARIDDPQQYAQQLYQRGEWQRVHVIDKAHLAQVARIAQAEPHRELTLDQYYHHVYQLLWGEPTGYVCVPPPMGHWHGWTYEYVREIVRNLPFSPASLVLGVFADKRWVIGLILICKQGRIQKVTTFEALPDQPIAAEASENALATLWDQIAQTLAPPAGMLLCSQEVFDTWIQQEEKMQVLHSAREQQRARWRWLSEHEAR